MVVVVVLAVLVLVVVLVDVVDGCDSGCGNAVAVMDIRGRFRIFG